MNAMLPQVSGADAGAVMERVVVQGDLSRLTPQERTTYYNAVCQSVGLNPLTRPFEYIKLNGREVLYAKKDCTDQLRSIHGVSIEVVSKEVMDGMVVVTARAISASGKRDEDIGAVPLPASGEARANAMMKAITKAKRRVTLSVCGLGFLDESEVESIPGAEPRDVPNMAAPDNPLAAIAAPTAEPEGREPPFTLRFLDDQLSQFHELDEIRGYLAVPKVRAAYYRAVDRGKGDAWSEIVQAHFARVAPELRDEPAEPEEEEPAA